MCFTLYSKHQALGIFPRLHLSLGSDRYGYAFWTSWVFFCHPRFSVLGKVMGCVGLRVWERVLQFCWHVCILFKFAFDLNWIFVLKRCLYQGNRFLFYIWFWFCKPIYCARLVSFTWFTEQIKTEVYVHFSGKSFDQYSPRPRDEPAFGGESGFQVLYQDPESLILAMERVTVLFDRSVLPQSPTLVTSPPLSIRGVYWNHSVRLSSCPCLRFCLDISW